MTRRAWIVFGLLAAGCYRSPAPVVANQTVVAHAQSRSKPARDHRYCETHEVPIVCDQPPPGEDMCPEEAEDTLEIRELSAGRIAVAIELVQTNGHTCSFEGQLLPATPSAPDIKRWTFSTSEGDEGAPCALELVKRGGEITISSTDCRYYCGARAVLDARFDTSATCPANAARSEAVE